MQRVIVLLLIYLPRKDERLSWPSWLTYSGRFTHIVVTRRLLQAEDRTGSVRRPKTGVLPTVLTIPNQMFEYNPNKTTVYASFSLSRYFSAVRLSVFSSAFSPASQLNISISCFSVFRFKSLEIITCQHPWISVTFYFQTSSKDILLSVSLPLSAVHFA